jgi:hypothetical protein
MEVTLRSEPKRIRSNEPLLTPSGSGNEILLATNEAYVAMCHFLFNSIEDFMAVFVPHAASLQSDMPNYTDIKPVIQFSEVVLCSKVKIT